jgi:hypothetical protein
LMTSQVSVSDEVCPPQMSTLEKPLNRNRCRKSGFFINLLLIELN